MQYIGIIASLVCAFYAFKTFEQAEKIAKIQDQKEKDKEAKRQIEAVIRCLISEYLKSILYRIGCGETKITLKEREEKFVENFIDNNKAIDKIEEKTLMKKIFDVAVIRDMHVLTLIQVLQENYLEQNNDNTNKKDKKSVKKEKSYKQQLEDNRVIYDYIDNYSILPETLTKLQINYKILNSIYDKIFFGNL